MYLCQWAGDSSIHLRSLNWSAVVIHDCTFLWVLFMLCSTKHVTHSIYLRSVWSIFTVTVHTTFCPLQSCEHMMVNWPVSVEKSASMTLFCFISNTQICISAPQVDVCSVDPCSTITIHFSCIIWWEKERKRGEVMRSLGELTILYFITFSILYFIYFYNTQFILEIIQLTNDIQKYKK